MHHARGMNNYEQNETIIYGVDYILFKTIVLKLFGVHEKYAQNLHPVFIQTHALILTYSD